MDSCPLFRCGWFWYRSYLRYWWACWPVSSRRFVPWSWVRWRRSETSSRKVNGAAVRHIPGRALSAVEHTAGTGFCSSSCLTAGAVLRSQDPRWREGSWCGPECRFFSWWRSGCRCSREKSSFCRRRFWRRACFCSDASYWAAPLWCGCVQCRLPHCLRPCSFPQ